MTGTEETVCNSQFSRGRGMDITGPQRKAAGVHGGGGKEGKRGRQPSLWHQRAGAGEAEQAGQDWLFGMISVGLWNVGWLSFLVPALGWLEEGSGGPDMNQPSRWW